MKPTPNDQASGGLQSDPKMHKRNSVMGEVAAGGKAVSGATVTIVATGESFPVEPSGFYILVLDPAKYGDDPKDLEFAAPGYAKQRHSVYIPKGDRIRLDVELKKGK